MNAYSLLLDIGGTDLKIAFAKDGILVEESVTRLKMPNLITNRPGEAKLESGKLLKLVNTAIANFIKEFGEPQRILISGQMGSWILTDKDGQRFTEIISWQDTSYFLTEDKIFLEVYGKQYCPVTKNLKDNGGEDWPGAPWRGLALECQNHPVEKTFLFHTLTSWVVWEITGRMNHVIHETDAAASGLLNIKNKKWIEFSPYLDKMVVMPNVLMKMELAGYIPESSIPVFVAVGDQQTSLLGAGLARDIAILNAGTGGQVAKLVSTIPQTPNKVRPYFGGQYIETITHIPSGRFIAKFLTQANELHGTNLDWKWLWTESRDPSPKPISPKIDWDYDTFLENYIYDQKKISEARDLFLSDLLNNFIIALMKLNLNDIERIILAGGVAQKWKLLQYEIHNKLEIDVEVSTSAETTLNGLAMLDSRAAKVVGEQSSLKKLIKIIKEENT